MTGEPCLKPGLARRRGRYDEEVARCEASRTASELNRLKVDKALALGTGDLLSAQERCLMMALLAHLDVAATAADRTAVWPGSARLCRLLGIGESTLRRLKGSLEEKGFILRRYDRRNRPLKDGALDLKPFLLRVPQLLLTIGHTEAAVAAEREDLAAERYDHRADTSAQGPNAERPKRNPPEDTSENVPSPDRKEGEQETAPALAQAAAIAPELGSVDAPIHENAARLAGDLFGEARGRRLLGWARRRRGDEAFLGLAIAAKSDAIRDRAAWFGWYATTAGAVDLAEQAETLLKASPRPLERPAPSDPLTARFFAAFAEGAGEGALGSYLTGARVTSREDTLVLMPKTRLAAQRLAERYGLALGDAAAALGFSRVEIAAAAPAGPVACAGGSGDSST